MHQEVRVASIIHSSLPALYLSVEVRSHTDSSVIEFLSSDFTGDRLLGIQAERRPSTQAFSAEGSL